MSDDAWKASGHVPTSDTPLADATQDRRFPGGELPSVTVILGELLKDLIGNFAGWLQFGVGTLAFMLLTFLLIIPPYALAMGPLIFDNDDSYLAPGLGLMMVALLVVTLLQIPWTNGQYRAMLAYQRGDVAMSVGAP